MHIGGDVEAGARRHLELAQHRLEDLRDQTNAFFAAKPYRMWAAADERRADHDLYRFRMTRRIPFGLQRRVRRLLRDLRRLDALLGGRLPGSSPLRELARLPIGVAPLVPGVRADTTLAMSGGLHASPATLTAPQWDARRREVTMLRRDPGMQLQGRIQVRFQLEFARRSEPGESAIAALGAALRDVERLLAGTGPAKAMAGPLAADARVRTANPTRRSDGA